jgi:type IV pilus assembly protein PilA
MSGTALNAGWTPPSATDAVSGVAVDAGNGQITISYTAIAGGPADIIMIPTSAGAALVSGTVPADAINWDCTTGTLNARYRPAECRP